MNDKVPPRAPFGSPGERTIIAPNPGGRRPMPPPGGPAPYTPQGPNAPQPMAPQGTPYAPPGAPVNPNPDEWFAPSARAAQPVIQTPAPAIRMDELVAANENPILRSAGPLLLLLGRLRVALARASLASLMGQVADAIAFFEHVDSAVECIGDHDIAIHFTKTGIRMRKNIGNA